MEIYLYTVAWFISLILVYTHKLKKKLTKTFTQKHFRRLNEQILDNIAKKNTKKKEEYQKRKQSRNHISIFNSFVSENKYQRV